MSFNEDRRYWSLEAHNYESGYPVLQTEQYQFRVLTTSNTATFQDQYGEHSVRVLAGQEAYHKYF